MTKYICEDGYTPVKCLDARIDGWYVVDKSQAVHDGELRKCYYYGPTIRNDRTNNNKIVYLGYKYVEGASNLDFETGERHCKIDSGFYRKSNKFANMLIRGNRKTKKPISDVIPLKDGDIRLKVIKDKLIDDIKSGTKQMRK